MNKKEQNGITTTEMSASFNEVRVLLNPDCLEEDKKNIMTIFKRYGMHINGSAGGNEFMSASFYNISDSGATERIRKKLESRPTAPKPEDSIS